MKCEYSDTTTFRDKTSSSPSSSDEEDHQEFDTGNYNLDAAFDHYTDWIGELPLEIDKLTYEDLEGEDPGDVRVQRPVFVTRSDYGFIPEEEEVGTQTRQFRLHGRAFFAGVRELDSVVCIICRVCVATDNLFGHLKDGEHKVAFKKTHDRGGVVCTKEELQEYCDNFSSFRNERHPARLVEAHALLREPEEAQKCSDCHKLIVQTQKRRTCPHCGGDLHTVLCQVLYQTADGKGVDAPVKGTFPRYVEVQVPLEDNVTDMRQKVFDAHRQAHFQNTEIADSPWLKRTCWSVHGKTLARSAIRAKWAEGAIDQTYVDAHNRLMANVMLVGQSPASMTLRQDANVCNCETQKYSEEPVEYLDTFRKLFCIIFSRPKLFIFTREQRQAYNTLVERPTDGTVMMFWRSIICHSYTDRAPYRPMEAGLAALNWDEKNATFRTPLHATQIMSHLLLCMRLLLVYFSMTTARVMKRHSLCPPTAGQVFEQECRRFVRTTRCSEGHTPASQLLSWRTYGRAINEGRCIHS